MSQLAPTLHRLVTEETGQSFYGLFIYNGNHLKPPPNSDPTLKLMQLRDSWIAFSDDRETDDCNKCAPPFVECNDGVRFCHLRFPLNAQGTTHAVQTLLDMLRTPATAFVVAYTADDLTGSGNGEQDNSRAGSGMNARSIMRFALNSRQKKEADNKIGEEKEIQEAEEEQKKKIQMWTVAGFVIVGIIAVIVGVYLLRKKNNQKREEKTSTGGEKRPDSSLKRRQSTPILAEK